MTPEQLAILILATSGGLVLLGIAVLLIAVAFFVWDATREPEPRIPRALRVDENT